MDPIRCPYCVDKNHFRIMTPRPAHLICEKCGHIVVLSNPTCECPCPRCKIAATLFKSQSPYWSTRQF